MLDCRSEERRRVDFLPKIKAKYKPFLRLRAEKKMAIAIRVRGLIPVSSNIVQVELDNRPERVRDESRVAISN